MRKTEDQREEEASQGPDRECHEVFDMDKFEMKEEDKKQAEAEKEERRRTKVCQPRNM